MVEAWLPWELCGFCGSVEGNRLGSASGSMAYLGSQGVSRYHCSRCRLVCVGDPGSVVDMDLGESGENYGIGGSGAGEEYCGDVVCGFCGYSWVSGTSSTSGVHGFCGVCGICDVQLLKSRVNVWVVNSGSLKSGFQTGIS